MQTTTCETVTFTWVKPTVEGGNPGDVTAYVLERSPISGGILANRKVLSDGRVISHFTTTPRFFNMLIMVEGNTFAELRATDDPIMLRNNTYQQVVITDRTRGEVEGSVEFEDECFIVNIAPEKPLSSGDYFTRKYMLELSIDNRVGEC
jgi:hypothetical protein